MEGILSIKTGNTIMEQLRPYTPYILFALGGLIAYVHFKSEVSGSVLNNTAAISKLDGQHDYTRRKINALETRVEVNGERDKAIEKQLNRIEKKLDTLSRYP